MEPRAAPPAGNPQIKDEGYGNETVGNINSKTRQRSRRKKHDADDDPSKRRCVSTACVACRKRKSKCDGNTPACAACSQVYATPCIYDPNSDHRRKGVYKSDVESLKTRNSTLQTLVTGLLNLEEEEAFDLVREIRTCDSLDEVAERIATMDLGFTHHAIQTGSDQPEPHASTFEKQLYGKMGDLRIEKGSVRYIGGTSHLIHIDNDDTDGADDFTQLENPITSWTKVTDDGDLVMHLLTMYFTWHYTFFTTLAKTRFFVDFGLGYAPEARRKTRYCTPLLVNAMLALGCHFTSHKGARDDPEDSATAGDHFFKEAKRLISEGDLHEMPRLTTTQALALMSVREAGCGREARGWVYSGMSFRMACDMGLNLNTGQLTSNKHVNGDEAEEDVRRITFWGCYLFDKCWSNYLGRLPQLPSNIVTAPKFDVFPDEDSEPWTPYTDSGPSQAHSQPSRTRTVALQISKLCEISNDLMNYFYNPTEMEKNRGKSAELKMLSSIHTRLEAWRRDLPRELEPREGALSSVLTMHMLFQILFIHLFRPFLKYTQATSPLPPTVSPRKLCTQAASMISKLMRLYKRSHGLRQICNIAVYILHSACTLHLLNLPDKNARRDIIHGVKHLEEIAEGWLCARRTLSILSILARKWSVELPEEAVIVLARTDEKYPKYASEGLSPASQQRASEMAPAHFTIQQGWLGQSYMPINTSMTGSPGGMRPGVPATQVDGYQAQPPDHANSVNATAYSSASASPQRPHTQDSAPETTNSPSGMFGGIEQLFRDSQEWVMRDQTQLANGFDNWASVDVDPSIWASAGVPGAGSITASATGMPMGSAFSIANAQMAITTTYADPGAFGPPGMDWFNGSNPEMTTYDENLWYN